MAAPMADFDAVVAIFNLTTLGSAADLRTLKDLFRFAGYEPIHIANLIRLRGGTDTLVDVRAMIVLGTERGNNLT
jgi:hypothetical protein